MPTHRPKEDQNWWNFLASLLFVVALVGVLWWFWSTYHAFPQSVPLFDAVLMAFAAFRITRLVVYDKIARWFRELFADVREFEKGGVVYVEIRPYGTGLRHTIYDLLQCPWCIGFWSALIIAFSYFVFPWAWFMIFFLALAGAGSMLQITANTIGWYAENLKLEAKERDRDLQL